MRVLGSMRKVGGRPAIDFCLTLAARKDQSEKRRQVALAALEGRLDRNNADDIRRVFNRRFGRARRRARHGVPAHRRPASRAGGAEKLYELFKTDKWKVRRAAAATVLRMSTGKQLEEFMSRLPDGLQKGYAMPESITYAARIHDLKDCKPVEALQKYLASGTSVQRTVALSYWLNFGTRADLAVVQPFEGDKMQVPVCETDNDCKWTCEVAKEGAADPSKDRENKDIKTVGEFVKYCVEPTMQEHQPEAKK